MLSSRNPITTASPSSPAACRPARQRARPSVVLVVAALVLAVAGVSAWRWHRQAVVTPPSTTGSAASPSEARLLAAAAQAPAAPGLYKELAEHYAHASRPASALWAYCEAETRAPSDPSLRLKAAAALVRLGEVAAAESMLRTALAAGGPGSAQARLDLADLLLSTGRPAAALAVLRGAGPGAEVARGRAAEAMGEGAAAAHSYRRAGAAGDPEGYERLARLELAAGHVKAASEAARSLGHLRTARPEDEILIAAISAAGGTPKGIAAAIAALLRCVQIQPENAEAYYQAGLLFLRKGDRTAGLTQLERAVKLDASHAEARGHLADLLQAMGQTARAHRERAAFYELKDQPDRSLAELRLAGAAGFPNDLDRTLMAARTATELQQLAAAVKEDQAGLKRHPGDPNLMTQLGLLYQMAGSETALDRLCRDWMASQPGSGLPYWLLGRRAVDATREAVAIRLFETACAKEPDRADFCAALGNAYLMAPTPENGVKARRWLEKAVALNPRFATAHQQLGRALEQAGDLAAARRQYLQSLDVQPGQTAVLNNLAQLSTRLQRPAEAHLFADLAADEEEQSRERTRLDRRVRDHPADPVARLELARFLIRRGELTTARNHLERAAEPGSAAAPARAALAEVNRLLRVQAG